MVERPKAPSDRNRPAFHKKLRGTGVADVVVAHCLPTDRAKQTGHVLRVSIHHRTSLASVALLLGGDPGEQLAVRLILGCDGRLELSL